MPPREYEHVNYYPPVRTPLGGEVRFEDKHKSLLIMSPNPLVVHIGLSIRRVIFNDPATIVIWADGSKTVVKVHDEPFDEEKGLAMAILKKLCGKAQLRREFKKWIKEEQSRNVRDKDVQRMTGARK